MALLWLSTIGATAQIIGNNPPPGGVLYPCESNHINQSQQLHVTWLVPNARANGEDGTLLLRYMPSFAFVQDPNYDHIQTVLASNVTVQEQFSDMGDYDVSGPGRSQLLVHCYFLPPGGFILRIVEVHGNIYKLPEECPDGSVPVYGNCPVERQTGETAPGGGGGEGDCDETAIIPCECYLVEYFRYYDNNENGVYDEGDDFIERGIWEEECPDGAAPAAQFEAAAARENPPGGWLTVVMVPDSELANVPPGSVIRCRDGQNIILLRESTASAVALSGAFAVLIGVTQGSPAGSAGAMVDPPGYRAATRDRQALPWTGKAMLDLRARAPQDVPGIGRYRAILIPLASIIRGPSGATAH